MRMNNGSEVPSGSLPVVRIFLNTIFRGESVNMKPIFTKIPLLILLYFF